MPLTRSNKIALFSAMAAVFIAGFLLALHFSPQSDDTARQLLLQLVPTDATTVFFVDLDTLSASPFLAKLYAWAPQPNQDSEYIQFVRDTGFSYERDLKRVVIAIANHGPAATFFVVADGKFDRKKIEAFFDRSGKSSQQGKWKVFQLNAATNERHLSFAFLANNQVAVGDSENFAASLAARQDDGSRSEWNTRFERLAGVPLFAVIRQDPAVQGAWNSVAPGGFRSPQLSALLGQLQWISIAGKPDGDQLRVIAEGESLSPSITSQLSDFLLGVLLLAQNGLNDPKLRQKMNPEERQAYLEILKSADVQKIDRDEWRSVRLVVEITPRFLDVARLAPTAAPADQTSTSPKASGKTPARAKSKTHTTN